MKEIILASASPRRKELLAKVGIDFKVSVADIEEVIPNGVKPYEVVMSLAFQKAQAVANNASNAVIIGADTVVVLDDEILGKPESEADAFRMLNMLSGKTHSVYTGVSIINGRDTTSFYEETKVEFYELTQEEITSYIMTKEPMDKAGAYGIQGLGCTLVRAIEGDYFNVVGLPVSKLYRELSKLK